MRKYNIVLTSEQKQFINNNDDLLMVSAGPGSGKTETLSRYISKNIENIKSHKKMIVSSYTQNGTREIKYRTKRYIDDSLDEKVIFTTFDSFMINKIWKFYFNRIILFAIKKWNIDISTKRISINKIEYAKLKWAEFSYIVKSNGNLRKHIKAFIEQAIQNKLNYGFVSEYILYEFIKSYQSKVADYIGSTYERIVIDEAQDLSTLRYNILLLLSKISKLKITLVGDAMQTLFKFNGASENVFEKLKKLNINFKEIQLTKNFRYLLRNNFEEDESMLSLLNSKNTFESMKQKITENIKNKYILQPSNFVNEINIYSKLGNILILVEKNSEAKEIRNLLKNANVKFRVVLQLEKNEFNISYDEKIFIEYLYIYDKLRKGEISNNFSFNVYEEIKNYMWPYDPKSDQKFLNLFWKNEFDINSIIEKVERKTGINIKGVWEKMNQDNSYVTLLPQENVQIMTIHASKGLESDYVFLKNNLINDFLTSIHSKKNMEKIFVAISRFKKKLFIINDKIKGQEEISK